MKLRKELAGLKRLVVKVGSNVVTKKDGSFDNRRTRILVEDICELRSQGIQVLLVSSGAVNIGRPFLNPKLFKDSAIEAQQAASSLGQPKLMQKYCSLFEENGALCSQILLTHEDFKSRQRYLNAKRTVETLLENGVTPILNENDTISFMEITVGDNDQLAAQAALLIEADALVLVTSAEGLCDRDPTEEGAMVIQEVAYGESLEAIDVSTKTSSGRGGMMSKLEAVQKACGFGIKTIIASKEGEGFVTRALTEKRGTYFHPRQIQGPKRKKLWLASLRNSEACIEVDKGAYEAVCRKKSLLPVGVTGASGTFVRGDCVNLVFEGKIFARGISYLDQRELDLVKGKRSEDIEALLGPAREKEVIHTENLVLEKDWKT